jgi:hypothetical protein
MKNKYSRRSFVKTGILSSAAIAGAGSMLSCTNQSSVQQQESLLSFAGNNYAPSDGVAGLMFSQIGYEPGLPVRLIIRLPRKELLNENATCRLTAANGPVSYSTSFKYWGEIWKSHWWLAEFDEQVEEGVWNIQVTSQDQVVFSDTGLTVKKNILWDSVVEWASVDMLERRRHFTGVGAGWQDAGTLWVESPAQSAMIIALAELPEQKREAFDADFNERIYKQLTVGCDYLVMTQEKAEELGFPKGSMSHDIKGHEKDILPHDAMKAVVALAKSSRTLPEKYSEQKQKYSKAARLAFRLAYFFSQTNGRLWLHENAKRFAGGKHIPKDEWPTRDLLVMCWAALEMDKLGNDAAKDVAVEYARQIMARQISKEKEESGFYGHFYEFSSMNHSETSWTHGIVPVENGVEFGVDMGGIYPNYLMPVIELLRMYPDHTDVEKWKQTLINFTYGYLIPAVKETPS